MKALIASAIATLISGGTHTIVSSAIKYEDDSKILTLENKLKNVPVITVEITEPLAKTPFDSMFYFEKGKLEGLSLCPKLHEKAFHKLNMTVTSNGHMVLDRANNRYMIPIKNSNPDSINMLNDSLEEPFNVPKGEIKVKPGK